MFEEFWHLAYASTFFTCVFCFILAWTINDNSIIDIFWGFGFIITSTILMILTENLTPRAIITLIFVFIWGIRLSFHIGIRHTGQEDYRYAYWRRTWSKKGAIYFNVRSFFQIYVLQFIFMHIVIASVSQTLYNKTQ
jgi:steroid 5-alpha reductase family enzyme